MIDSILIANRGEIVCRIIRTCRRLGIRTVAVFSDADSEALHVELADEAIHIGPALAGESYLNIDAILGAAERTGVDAIHPGFGFQAENADFARACEAASIVFIGPSAATIEAMGNKRAAKEQLAAAGISIIPGYGGSDQDDARLQREAERIGFPILVKAAAGGGGKGMRFVTKPGGLLEALGSARREAKQAFGSDELILERALANPRHVEFQIFGDQHGNVIHLGERECSIQRRHQKIVEETPSPALTPELRAQMAAAAVAAGRALEYYSAGTVEFLLDGEGQFYFLEMNTRLQVEHPVTEAVTGLDLVEWQIRIAEGEPLPLRQAEVEYRGHAVEARVYAEDPANQFLPTTGEVLVWREPVGEGIRVDSGIRSGDQVSIHYDPMLTKIVAHGPDRATAIRRLLRALEATTLFGLKSNLGFLRAVVSHPAFQKGDYHTHFVEEQFANWREPDAAAPLALIAATLAQWMRHSQVESNASYWRNNPNRPQLYRYLIADGEEPVNVQLAPAPRSNSVFLISLSFDQETTYTVELNERSFLLAPASPPEPLAHQRQAAHRTPTRAMSGQVALTVDGHRHRVIVASAADTWWVHTRTGVVTLRSFSLLPEPQPPPDAGGSLRAPMPGSVLEVLVEVGERVTKGQPLMKLEAMKMEHTIRVEGDGVIEAIYYAPGDTVEADAQLLKIAERSVVER